MNKIFQVRNKHYYNLKQNSQFSRPLVKAVCHKTEILSYLEPKLRNIPPNIFKSINGLDKFKKAIKK